MPGTINETLLKEFLTKQGLKTYDTAIKAWFELKEQEIKNNSIKISRVSFFGDLPSLGDSNTIYLETDKRKIYIWDPNENRYYVYGDGDSELEALKLIDGGDSVFE